MNERTLFLAALEIDDPVARSAYLDQAAPTSKNSSPAVESLLQAHAKESSFLDQPAVEDLFDSSSAVLPGLIRVRRVMV